MPKSSLKVPKNVLEKVASFKHTLVLKSKTERFLTDEIVSCFHETATSFCLKTSFKLNKFAAMHQLMLANC